MLSEFNSPDVGSGWRSTRYAATPPETLVPSWCPVTFQSNESSKFSSVWPKSKSFQRWVIVADSTSVAA